MSVELTQTIDDLNPVTENVRPDRGKTRLQRQGIDRRSRCRLHHTRQWLLQFCCARRQQKNGLVVDCPKMIGFHELVTKCSARPRPPPKACVSRTLRPRNRSSPCVTTTPRPILTLPPSATPTSNSIEQDQSEQADCNLPKVSRILQYAW